MGTRQIRNTVFRAGTQGEAGQTSRNTNSATESQGLGGTPSGFCLGLGLVVEARTGLNRGHQARYALGLLLPLLYSATELDYPQLVEQWSSVFFPPRRYITGFQVKFYNNEATMNMCLSQISALQKCYVFQTLYIYD